MKKYKTIFISLLAIGCVFSAFQCAELNNDPVMPTWDVELSLPFINRIYTLEDILERNPDLLTTDLDGTIIFQYFESLEADPIGDMLRLQPRPSEFSVSIGTLQLPLPSFEFPVSFDDIITNETNHTPYSGLGPILIQPDAHYSFPDIDYVLFESGEMTLTIENKTGIAAAFPEGVRLMNPQGGEIVTFPVTNTVEDGEEFSSTLSLSDILIPSGVGIEFMYENPSTEENDTIPDHPEIIFSFESRNTRVREARAIIPGQEPDERESGFFIVDEDNAISRATFRQGIIDIDIESQVDLEATVRVTIQELHRPGDQGKQFEMTIPISPHESVRFPVDLREWEFSTSPYAPVTSATVTVDFIKAGSGGQFATIRATDNFISRIETSELPGGIIILDELTGILTPFDYEIDERVSTEFDNISGDFEGELSFGDVNLILGLHLDADFPAEAELFIVGMNEYGIIDSMAVPDDMKYLESGEWNYIRFDRHNSRIDDFLSSFFPNFPDELALSGTALINPDGAIGTITSETVMTSTFEFEIPFTIGIRNGLFTDTLSIGTTGANINRELIDIVNYGHVYFETINHLPLGFSFRMGLLDKRGELIHMVPRELHPPIDIAPAPVDDEGRVIEPTGTQVQFVEVFRGDIDFFEEAESALVIFTVNTPDDVENVRMRAVDDVRIKVFANLNVRVAP